MSKMETVVEVSGAPGYADFTGVLVGARESFSEGREVTWYQMPDVLTEKKCVVAGEEDGKVHLLVVPEASVTITGVRKVKTEKKTYVVGPGQYAEGAGVVYDPDPNSEYPWRVESRYYDIHNGERYRDDQVCAGDVYAWIGKTRKPRRK